MKPPHTQSAPPPDTNSYELPAELAATPHPVVEAEQRAAAIVGQVVAAMREEFRGMMHSVQLELRAITNDNEHLRSNLVKMNVAMGEFQLRQIIPLRESLEHLRDEQGSVVVENSRKLEGLIQALTKTVDAAGGLIPADLKQQILDGRFENLEHAPEGSLVPQAQVQAMIEEAYRRGRADARN